MKNFVSQGDTLIWTNGTGATVASGAPVAVGVLLGVAGADIAPDVAGAVAISGVYLLPKGTGAIAAGEAVVFDVSAGKIMPAGTATAAGDLSGGCVAVAAAASGDTLVPVRLNVGPSAVA